MTDISFQEKMRQRLLRFGSPKGMDCGRDIRTSTLPFRSQKRLHALDDSNDLLLHQVSKKLAIECSNMLIGSQDSHGNIYFAGCNNKFVKPEVENKNLDNSIEMNWTPLPRRHRRSRQLTRGDLTALDQNFRSCVDFNNENEQSNMMVC